MVAGITHFRALPADPETQTLRGETLATAIRADRARGWTPFFVCGTLGTTGVGAVDDLWGLGRVAKEEKCWFHIDAAWAGAALVCPEVRDRFLNREIFGLIDSFDMNPHKWLLTNFDCSALWVKDRRPLVQALTLNPVFLQNAATASGEVIDYKDWQVPLGRRFRALKLFFVLKTYGTTGLQRYIRGHLAMAEQLATWMRESSIFTVVNEVHFALVCFRWDLRDDEAQMELLRRVNATGRVFLTHASVGGTGVVLRCAVGGALTTMEDVRGLWTLLVEEAKGLGAG